jgi:hypothetical protein
MLFSTNVAKTDDKANYYIKYVSPKPEDNMYLHAIEYNFKKHLLVGKNLFSTFLKISKKFDGTVFYSKIPRYQSSADTLIAYKQ